MSSPYSSVDAVSFAEIIHLDQEVTPGAVARSHERPPGMRTVAGSIQHSFVEFGHENISTAILSLPLMQKGQLSVTGEIICTKCW